MIKKIVAVAIVVALSACSGSNDSGNNDAATNTATGEGSTADGSNAGASDGNNSDSDDGAVACDSGGPLIGDGQGPVAGTKAGSYIGNFGGAQGVYVINNDNKLAGLAINENGSAQSLFGVVGAGDTFTGELCQYLHQENRPNPADGVFASVAGAVDPLPIDVTIVNGQTIESTVDSPTAVALTVTAGSAITKADVASLAGDWSAVNNICDAGDVNCKPLETLLTFNGTQVSGSTQLDGGVLFDISGTITEFGDAALVNFSWGDAAGYSGVVFFSPAGDGRIVFIGENQVVGPVTISALLTRQ